MSKIIRKTVVVSLTAVFLLAAAWSNLQAESKYLLKFNHVLSPDDPYHIGFTNWAKQVKEKTNGELEVQVFHSAQLGVEEEIIAAIQAGVSFGQNTDAARLSKFVPDIAVINAPYFITDYHDVFKLGDTPSVKAWKTKLEKEFGIKLLSFNWVQGFRHIVCSKPIKRPEDLNNLRIRTPGVPVWQESIRSIGATPVPLAFGEIYRAMQQKIIDGCDNVYNATYAGKLYEVATHLSETKHILLINFEIVSAAFFNSLPPQYQKILVEENEKVGIETSKLVMDQYSADSKKKLIEKRMTIVEDADLNAFQKAGEKAYEVLNLSSARKQIYSEMGK